MVQYTGAYRRTVGLHYLGIVSQGVV